MRHFWRLWTASSIANLADGFRSAALPLLAAGLTRRPALVAGVEVALRLGWLLFGLQAGALVDRVDRRLLLWTVNAARAAALAALALVVGADALNLPLLYGVAFILGVGETLFDTSSSSAVPRCTGARATGDRGLRGADGRCRRGAGAALGGLLADRLAGLVGQPRALLGAVVLAATAQLMLGLTTDPRVAGVFLGVSSAAYAVFNVVGASLRQALVPDRMLGGVWGPSRTVVGAGTRRGASGWLAWRCPRAAGALPRRGAAAGRGRVCGRTGRQPALHCRCPDDP